MNRDSSSFSTSSMTRGKALTKSCPPSWPGYVLAAIVLVALIVMVVLHFTKFNTGFPNAKDWCSKNCPNGQCDSSGVCTPKDHTPCDGSSFCDPDNNITWDATTKKCKLEAGSWCSKNCPNGQCDSDGKCKQDPCDGSSFCDPNNNIKWDGSKCSFSKGAACPDGCQLPELCPIGWYKDGGYPVGNTDYDPRVDGDKPCITSYGIMPDQNCTGDNCVDSMCNQTSGWTTKAGTGICNKQ